MFPRRGGGRQSELAMGGQFEKLITNPTTGLVMAVL